jgi:hypothetical protein
MVRPSMPVNGSALRSSSAAAIAAPSETAALTFTVFCAVLAARRLALGAQLEVTFL